MTHKRKLSFLALLAAIFAVYAYVWFLAAHKVETALLVEVQRLEEKNYTVDYGSIHVKGFPFQLDVEIDSLYIQTPTTNGPYPISFLIQETIHGSASIFNPQKIHLYAYPSLKGRNKAPTISVSFTSPKDNDREPTLADMEKEDILFTAQRVKATLELFSSEEEISKAPQTFPEKAAPPQNARPYSLVNVHLGDVSSYLLTSDTALKATTIDDLILQITFHPKDIFLNTYGLDVRNLTFPKSFLPNVPKTIKQVRFNFSMHGDIQRHLPLDQAILKWYKTDGLIDVKEALIEWGKVKIVGNGTLALDGALQPIMAFAMDIYGLNDILDMLDQSGVIPPALSTILKIAVQNTQSSFMGILKKEDFNKDGSTKTVYHKVSITTQDNELMIGTIPIFKYAPFDWVKTGPQPTVTPSNSSVENASNLL